MKTIINLCDVTQIHAVGCSVKTNAVVSSEPVTIVLPSLEKQTTLEIVKHIARTENLTLIAPCP
jgi:hypothetical protein